MKRIQRLLLCVLLCLAVLPVSASADTGPKPAVTITVVNAPAGDYYLDLLIQDPGDYPNIDPEDYDPPTASPTTACPGPSASPSHPPRGPRPRRAPSPVRCSIPT